LFATGLTVVLVTHRLSPLKQADEILLITDGTIAARGDQAYMLKNCPPYREAWLTEQAAVV
jgi:ATP-binding cassette subfamily B protein